VNRQPSWCNVKIGTWCGAALGIAQNMAAPTAPDEAKAPFVSAACSDYCHSGDGARRRCRLVIGPIAHVAGKAADRC
jgi:hypothetical protein